MPVYVFLTKTVEGTKYFMLCTLWGLSLGWMDQKLAHQVQMAVMSSQPTYLWWTVGLR